MPADGLRRPGDVYRPWHDGLAEPIRGRSVWTGAELVQDWVWRWPEGAMDEIEYAWDRLVSSGKLGSDLSIAGIERITREDFPLPGLRSFFRDLLDELADRGAVRVVGFDLSRWGNDHDVCRAVYWCVGTHLGFANLANGAAHEAGESRLYEVTANVKHNVEATVALDSNDERLQKYLHATGAGDVDATAVVQEVGVLTASQRRFTNGPLRFHTDPYDVISLFCFDPGISGGESKLASIPCVCYHFHIIMCNCVLARPKTFLSSYCGDSGCGGLCFRYIYNQILQRRPDLHKLLCEDWPHMRPFADQGTANRDQPVGEVFYMPVRTFSSMLCHTQFCMFEHSVFETVIISGIATCPRTRNRNGV